MTTYALTGVTGRFGRTAVKRLVELVGSENVVALARNVERAKKLVPAGVTVRPGNYDDVDQLTTSLQGVDRLLLISSQPGGPVPREQQHRNVIDAAKAAGVSFMAYTSFPRADRSTAALAADHRVTEDYIRDSGLDYSFLRNNWYLENESSTLRHAHAGRPFVYSAAAGKAGWALEREYAEAAADVLAMDRPRTQYEFAGPARTYKDLADATQGDFDVLSVDDEAYSAGLQQAGLDEPTAQLITSFQTLIRDGQLDVDSTDLQDVLGHELTPIEDAIHDVVGD